LLLSVEGRGRIVVADRFEAQVGKPTDCRLSVLPPSLVWFPDTLVTLTLAISINGLPTSGSVFSPSFAMTSSSRCTLSP
jgi:hypothetical protein